MKKMLLFYRKFRTSMWWVSVIGLCLVVGIAWGVPLMADEHGNVGADSTPDAVQSQGWLFSQKLTVDGMAPGANEFFGVSGAITPDGRVAVIAAPYANVPYWDEGLVFVFERVGNRWVQRSRIESPDENSQQSFGFRVAIAPDGRTLLIGAHGTNVGANTKQGMVYVYTREDDTWTWTLQQRITPPDGHEGMLFGIGMAVDAGWNVLAVGAQGATPENRGKVYIYEREGNRWVERVQLQPASLPADLHWGADVALSADGKTLAVGSIGAYNVDWLHTGMTYVYIFEKVNGAWVEKARLDSPQIDSFFGFRLRLDPQGKMLIIGAERYRVGSNEYQGRVFVYEKRGNTWQQTQIMDTIDGGAYHFFGHSIVISANGELLFLGDYGARRVYMYRRSGGRWVLDNMLAPPSGVDALGFGFDAVLVSEDASIVIVGAGREITGPDNGRWGAAYIFTRPPCYNRFEGWVFEDVNYNGQRDADEPGIGGVVIALEGPVTSKTISWAPRGAYSFVGVPGGVYTLTVEVPAGWYATTDTARRVEMPQGWCQKISEQNFGLTSEPLPTPTSTPTPTPIPTLTPTPTATPAPSLGRHMFPYLLQSR